MIDDDDNLDELLDTYSSKSDIHEAMKEKQAGEFVEEESMGEKVKDYPKPQRELDLHGKKANEAEREIEWFLNNAQKVRIRTVRIISGKGLHSTNLKSVLPEVTERKIADLKQEGLILNFKREKTGGSFIVYLT